RLLTCRPAASFAFLRPLGWLRYAFNDPFHCPDCAADHLRGGIERASFLRLARRQVRRGEALPVEADLADAYRRERLAMPAQLLVLLLALVMEDQDLVAPALFHDGADHTRPGFRTANLAFAAADRQHVAKLNHAFFSRRALDANYVSKRNTILLSAGADHRVHRNLRFS